MKKFLLCLLFLCGVSAYSYAASVKFQFYGTDLCVKAKKKGFPQIERYDTVNISSSLDAILKKHIFDGTIKDCLILKEKLRLNDWGYFVMLEELSKSYANTYTKSPAISTLILAYLCSKSGYDVRLGLTSDNQMVLLYAAKEVVFNNRSFYDRNMNETFYLYQKKRWKE